MIMISSHLRWFYVNNECYAYVFNIFLSMKYHERKDWYSEISKIYFHPVYLEHYIFVSFMILINNARIYNNKYFSRYLDEAFSTLIAEKIFFTGDMEILAYFFGPIGFLLAVNLLFFAATARELTCGLWKGEFVKSTTER